MVSQHDLQQLASYQGDDVLSLYLDVDPSRRTPDEYRLALRHLLSSINGRAAEEISRIEMYFDHEYDRSGRSVVLFSSQRSDLWRTFALMLPVNNLIHVGDKPYLAPLVALWDTYGSYGVVLVDRLGSKMLHYQLGELVSVEGTLGEDVRAVKAGRGSSVVGQRGGSEGHAARRVAEVVRRNLKESLAAATAFFAANQCKQIVVGGADDVIKEFVEALPAPWPGRLAGTFPAPIDMPEPELREATHKLLAEMARRREHELADRVITAAAKGSNGVARLDDTLSAAHEGRIQTLLVSDGYDAAGYHCNQCGYLTTQSLATCPFCGGTFTYIAHAVEATIAKVLAAGGDVKMIEDHAQLKEAGIAALLRY
jgi:peptide chain release factor subunit 1